MEKIFEINPNLKEVFTTADGECFYKHDDAKNHAKTLVDKTVKHVKKSTAATLSETPVESTESIDLEAVVVEGVEEVTAATATVEEKPKEPKSTKK